MFFKKRTPQSSPSVTKSLHDAPASANHEVAEVKKEVPGQVKRYDMRGEVTETLAQRLTRGGHVVAPLVGSATRLPCRFIGGRLFAIDYSREAILKD